MDPVGGSDTDATDASDSDASATDSNTSEAGGKKMGRKAAAKANAAATAILEGECVWPAQRHNKDLLGGVWDHALD